MRTLDPLLDTLQVAATNRRPRVIVECFDLRSTESDPQPTTLADVVRFRVADPPPVLPALVGPFDLTGFVTSLAVNEQGADWIDRAVAASSIEMTLVDPSGELDPLESPSTGRWLRSGNVVQVREGDDAVDPSLWPITLTAVLVGQPGVSRNRTTGQSTIQLSGVDRSALYLNQVSTSISHPQGTAYSVLVEHLAEDMNLTPDEIALPASFGTTLTSHRSTQFVDDSPLVSIAKTLFASGGLVPDFDGYGRLVVRNGNVEQAPARTYVGDEILLTIERPHSPYDGVNTVRVLGLSSEMSQIVQTRQVLARASITTGYFSQNAEIPVRWSDDETLQARNTRLEIGSSVGAGLFNFGSESYEEATQLDGNSVGGTIKVQGAIALGLALLAALIPAWAKLELTPEPTITSPGGGPGTVVRPNAVAIAKVVAQQAVLQALSTVGRGEYRVTGEIVEFVFAELVGIARTRALDLGFLEQEREVELRNDLLNTQSAVDAAALRVLKRERAKRNVRDITSLIDLRIEPNDTIETANGRRYMVSAISRRYSRGQAVAEISAFETTAGLRP